MIPRLRPQLGWREVWAAMSPSSGAIERFEAAFAAEMGQEYALAFPYGRTGLLLLLEAMGLRGREVICPAYTCVVVPHAVVTSGNKPVFVDSDPADFNMCLEAAESAITEQTGALVATSIFGYPVDLDRLKEIGDRHPHLLIIQDCAHSFAAEWHGRPVQRAGDAAIFGMNISKLMTSVFGGMVTTDDPVIAARLLDLRAKRVIEPGLRKSFLRLLYMMAIYPAFTESVYGIVNRLERTGLLDRFVRYYSEFTIDMPGDYLDGITLVEARVGRANLTRYREIVRRRRFIAEYYFEHLPDRANFRLPPRITGATYSHFVVRVPDRARWLERGLKDGIQFGQLIEYSIPELPAYGGHTGDYPVAEALARETLNLPVWGDRWMAERVVRFVHKMLRA